MAQTGTVVANNPIRNMVAIDTRTDAFTIIEVPDIEDFQIGDQIVWDNSTGLGPEKYRNLTKEKYVDVLVQNHNVPKEQLTQQLLV